MTMGAMGAPAAPHLQAERAAGVASCSPGAAVGCWRRRMVLSAPKSPCILRPQTEHCTIGSVASATIVAVGDEVVPVGSGRHRRKNAAS